MTGTQLATSSRGRPCLPSPVPQSSRLWGQAPKRRLSDAENTIGPRLKIIIKGLLIPLWQTGLMQLAVLVRKRLRAALVEPGRFEACTLSWRPSRRSRGTGFCPPLVLLPGSWPRGRLEGIGRHRRGWAPAPPRGRRKRVSSKCAVFPRQQA